MGVPSLAGGAILSQRVLSLAGALSLAQGFHEWEGL